MTKTNLKAFGKISFQEQVSIEAFVQKINGILKIQYHVEDPLSLIDLHIKDGFFRRTRELWQFTCFECFFAEKGKENYWEVNLDHSGNWNVYRFDKYRQPQPPLEEILVKQIEFEFVKKAEGFELQCEVDLKDLGLQEKSLEVSLNSVIEWKNKEKSYYASAHCGGEKPDFHLREAFICNLE
jgi:hypothetical protein